MKALTWQGKRDVRVIDVPDPRIEEPTDAVIKVTSTAICGSDLHLFHNLIHHLIKLHAGIRGNAQRSTLQRLMALRTLQTRPLSARLEFLLQPALAGG